MRNKTKITTLQIAIILFIISVVFAVVTYFFGKTNEKYKKEGIEINAEITRRYSKSKTGKTFAKDYYIDVYFFPKSKMNSDTVADIFDENFYANNVGHITKSVSAKISITRETYQNLINTDSIQILYLPDEPNNARLKKSVENFNVNWGYYFSLVIFLIGLITIIIKKLKI